MKLSGAGLEKAIVDKPNEFIINTKDAGAGNIGLAIEGPAEAKINCKDNGDGTCSVSYVPIEAGMCLMTCSLSLPFESLSNFKRSEL